MRGAPAARPRRARRSGSRRPPRSSVATTRKITSALSGVGARGRSGPARPRRRRSSGWRSRRRRGRSSARTPTETIAACARKPSITGSSPSASGGTSGPGVVGGAVDRRHELRREHQAHDLADRVGREHARDAEPVRHLERERGLADARGAAEQQDHRALRLLVAAPDQVALGRLGADAPRERLEGEVAQLACGRSRGCRAAAARARSARATSKASFGSIAAASSDWESTPFEKGAPLPLPWIVMSIGSGRSVLAAERRVAEQVRAPRAGSPPWSRRRAARRRSRTALAVWLASSKGTPRAISEWIMMPAHEGAAVPGVLDEEAIVFATAPLRRARRLRLAVPDCPGDRDSLHPRRANYRSGLRRRAAIAAARRRTLASARSRSARKSRLLG